MSELDDSNVNDLEVGVIGSGSMGAVSNWIQRWTRLMLGDDAPILRTWIPSWMLRYR